MHSHRVSTVEIDEERLTKELEQAKEFDFAEPYDEFLCSRPARRQGQIMLWAPGGDNGDGIIKHYDDGRASGVTEYGRQLPYLVQIMEESLSVRHLRFARLAALTSNVLVPHRDYVEFDTAAATDKRPAHRLHIPLITFPDCYFSDDNVVFQMAAGEVWFLDVTKVHSAANLSDELRLHLIVDFVDTEDHDELLTLGTEAERVIPDSRVVHRPPLPDAARQALYGLADVVDPGNLREVFGLVAKAGFQYDGGENFFWRTIAGIRDRVADPAMAARLAELDDYFLCARAT